MKTNLITCVSMIGMLLGLTLFSGCGDDDDPATGDELTGASTTYTLSERGGSGVSGTAVFEELADGSTRITVALNGTTAGDNHPAHIHEHTAAEGGSIVIDFEPIDGGTGRSVTYVSTTNAGDDISYEELIRFDGYINVHHSESDLGTLLAQGDIGGNVLTGESEDYELLSVSDPEIHGEAYFFERENGETLIQIFLEDDAEDSDHPAHIHMNSAAVGGSIVLDLNNVRAGFSQTNVTAFNNGDPVTYNELTEYDGYINVHLSTTDLATLVAQGNIGSNAE